MDKKDTTKSLQRIWNRLRVFAITLQSADLEKPDVQEIGRMIEDILVDELQPAIEEA